MQIKSRLSPQREAQILEVAIDLVAEFGFDRVTFDALAARAGTSKTTLYKRWPNKSVLIAAAVQQRSGLVFWFPDQGSFRADVLCALQRLTEWLQRDATLLRALADIGRRDQQLVAEMDQRLVQPHNEMWEQCVIDRARDRGELRPDIDLSWLNELCEGVLFSRVILLDTLASAAYLERLTDEVVIPLFAMARS